MIGSIFPLCPDDVPYPGRSASLPGKLFADMYRDPLECVSLLFELSFGASAPPLPKSTVRVSDTGPLSLFCPAFFCHFYGSFLRYSFYHVGQGDSSDRSSSKFRFQAKNKDFAF